MQGDRPFANYRALPPDDGELREALKEAAAKRHRWGYRMLTVLMRRQGFTDNHKRIYRVYGEEDLQVPVRRRRRTARWRGRRPEAATHRTDRWSMDFMSDQLACGRRIRTLNIVDDHTRECLAIEADVSIGGERVCRVLDRIVASRGRPKRILTDNGSEFTGRALDRWANEHRVKLEFIEPGKPMQNAFVESFNGTVRHPKHKYPTEKRLSPDQGSLTLKPDQSKGAGQTDPLLKHDVTRFNQILDQNHSHFLRNAPLCTSA